MLKGNCSECGRKIQKTITDTCKYCEAALEPSKCFTQEEKQQIIKAKKELAQQLTSSSKHVGAKGSVTPIAGGGDFSCDS